MRSVERIIEWTDDGYPTESSLERLKAIVTGEDLGLAAEAFYQALKENHWPDFCGPGEVEVRGKVIPVWGYHTGGWSGNEAIIGVLQSSWWWTVLLERYDRGGHYYFKPPDNALVKASKTRRQKD